MSKTNKKKQTHRWSKLVVISCGMEVGRGERDSGGERVIMGLCEIMHVK